MDFRENSFWLMSEWDFEPPQWGGIGFPYRSSQDKIADAERNATENAEGDVRAIVAIYIASSTKVAVARAKKKKVVGFVEPSGLRDNIRRFVSPEILAVHRQNPDNANKWPYAAGIKRAWKIRENSLRDVGYVFSNTYTSERGRTIGTNAEMVVSERDFNQRIANLQIQAVDVWLPNPAPELPAQRVARLERHETAGDLLRTCGALIE